MLVFNLYASEKAVKSRIKFIRKTIATLTKNFTENHEKALNFINNEIKMIDELKSPYDKDFTSIDLMKVASYLAGIKKIFESKVTKHRPPAGWAKTIWDLVQDYALPLLVFGTILLVTFLVSLLPPVDNPHGKLFGHNGHVLSVAWGPNGNYLASASADNTVKIWDVTSRKNVLTLNEHKNNVFVVSWSPDGKYLASGSLDSTIKVWQVTFGGKSKIAVKLIRDFDNAVYSDSPDSSYISTMSWGPDSKRIAFWSGWKSGDYRKNSINILDISNGQISETQEGHSVGINSIAWSPNGDHIALGCIDYNIKILDVKSGKISKILSGHENRLNSVAWSPNGEFLSSGAMDGTMRVWNFSTGTLLKTVSRQDNSSVDSVEWSPNGKYIVTSHSYSEATVVWDAFSGKPLSTFKNHSDHMVTWDPSGKRLASTNSHEIKVWEVKF